MKLARTWSNVIAPDVNGLQAIGPHDRPLREPEDAEIEHWQPGRSMRRQPYGDEKMAAAPHGQKASAMAATVYDAESGPSLLLMPCALSHNLRQERVLDPVIVELSIGAAIWRMEPYNGR
jgi:hypothetical protein